ncbi:MAG: SlyX family protein [Sporomusaceae bacterium]|jgi:hypothetical protein|nr:SlyX family protein [Sporomusaceae bacterium]
MSFEITNPNLCPEETAAAVDAVINYVPAPRRTVEELERIIAAQQAQLEENETKIINLTERLKNSFHMDNISRNQELVTLKTNIAKRLKLEYSDFLDSKHSECNVDNFIACIGSLERIFMVLRQHGISCE